MIQCSWKYYRLRKRASVIGSFKNASFSNSRKNVSFRRGMSAISRKTCEENFQRSLMKWRKIRQYIRCHSFSFCFSLLLSHEFNTQMGSESNPAQRNEHQQSAESHQEGTESHSDFDSPQTTLDMDCERQQHAIQQPAPPAFRRWAKVSRKRAGH